MRKITESQCAPYISHNYRSFCWCKPNLNIWMHVFWHETPIVFTTKRTIYYCPWIYHDLFCTDEFLIETKVKTLTRNKNGISNTFYLDTHSLNRYSLCATLRLQLKQEKKNCTTATAIVSYITAAARWNRQKRVSRISNTFDLTCK